ncbi:MMAC-like protein, partial [Mya arenaria]
IGWYNEVVDENFKFPYKEDTLAVIFPQHDIEAIHDFELHPSHRPKVLVQTAGHVAGAAYYYQRKDVQPDPWGEETKIFGVSVHPKFGGWFALRGVLIFKDLQCPDLPKKAPDDIVPTHELRKELLERFNFRWQDWTYRDIILVEGKYSEHQKLYFETPPKDRPQLIQKLKRELK